VPTQEELNDLLQRLRRVPEVAEALDRMWPRLSPHEFLHDLLGARPLLAAAGKGILSAADVQRLYRPRSATLDAVQWTADRLDAPDVLRSLLLRRAEASADPQDAIVWLERLGELEADRRGDLNAAAAAWKDAKTRNA